MKLFHFFSLFFIFFNAHAQFDWDDRNWRKKTIGFACSITGEQTLPVAKMRDMVFDQQDYGWLKKQLFSQRPAYQFLAVFALEKLAKKKVLTLTQEERTRIAEIKRFQERVPVCAGCTYWDQEPLAVLLDTKNKHIIYHNAENWFKFHYKRFKRRK